MPGPDFLALPARAVKPRATGITHVLDRGLTLAQAADLLTANGSYVDVWKLGWGSACGFPCVEVSAGTVAMADAAKQDLIEQAAEHFIVLAEVGPKDPGVHLTPGQWAQAVSRDLQAGATWVLAEGRASGTVGIYDASGAVHQDVIEAMVSVTDPGSIVFEAPRDSQQAWFVRRFGPDVNLANVHPADALGLETLRLSLRADTYRAWSPGPAPVHGT